ncbi:family 16 glycosylhydrolase [Sphaerisporangium siamense]|uniref:Beta-glucanase n=1 Tax=Sphaerisporangium siamense TaxID=795645 RepID=A0A7W7D6W7_9ACTN|nr:family 16 glycosylhydrolase [Sphaerisporangium siamense]MBB4701074.1 GR25 family glycosyltransferase involved in LPS biosynthesis [Sphaerisporangium siamense]
MNKRTFADFRQNLLHYGRLRLRLADWHRRAAVFSRAGEPDALRRIYVINLDRRPDRWRRVRGELDRFRDRHGERLSAVTRRFSAVDARYTQATPDPATLVPRFTLADQLTVEPNPLLRIDAATRAREIMMTRQEVAVALSHIEVWKLIASGDVPSALVLEDDIFMAYGFARGLDATWSSLDRSASGEPDFDLLYLAFEEVGNVDPVRNGASTRRLQEPGIWEASGYVLSRAGAQKLLDHLPVYGPVDLWLNMQFSHMRAYTAARPLIAQRIDEPSSNSYSILPILSQVGVITREKPLVPATKHLPGPVVAVGSPGSGLTALATALSMLGYTCCSDLDGLPAAEEQALLRGGRRRLFNAYVNIGSLSPEALHQIVGANPSARIIVTSTDLTLPRKVGDRALLFTHEAKDRWALLSDFLGVDYPSFPYPTDVDLGMRIRRPRALLQSARNAMDLKHDTSPWIATPGRIEWDGITISAEPPRHTLTAHVDWTSGGKLNDEVWKLRDDTFPSNMALFTPANVSQHGAHARLTLRPEQTPVRELTSGAIASRAVYRYGKFSAELRPPGVTGVVTGMFLHRNGPRQEIDIEFLGKDTTKMLVNVFYNPGPEGTKLEYGYRGTPTLIDLGFDAAHDFHTYGIDWQPGAIRWLVDGSVVHERVAWDPTPIPNQSLQFNINLWHSRSKEFAGDLATDRLPTSAHIRSVAIHENVTKGDQSDRRPF